MTKPLRYVLVDELPEVKENPSAKIYKDKTLNDFWTGYRRGYNRHHQKTISKCREIDPKKLESFIQKFCEFKPSGDFIKDCERWEDEGVNTLDLAQAIIQHIKDGCKSPTKERRE